MHVQPPPDENDPFERLENTHRRMEERLSTLSQASADVPDPARRMDALDAVYDVLGFFERAAVRHHQDEELSLFPRLKHVHELADTIAMLKHEHTHHDKAFAELNGLVRSFGDEGPDSAGEAHLIELAGKFRSLYMGHIEIEERELFPAARRALDRHTQVEMAKEMADRRGGGGGGGGGGRGRDQRR